MQQDLVNDRFKDASFQIIGVSIDDMLDYLAGFKRSVGNAVTNGGEITFPWVACNTWIHMQHYKDVQEEWELTTEYQILAVIDRDGVIRYKDWGGDAVSKNLDYKAAFNYIGVMLGE